jgi:hypothetical protein
VADLRSIELLLRETRAEREVAGRLHEALEARAGVILGFTGILIALLPGRGALTLVGAGFAAATALTSLWTLLPWIRVDLDPGDLSDDYASADVAFTYSGLLAAQIRSWMRLRAAVRRKAARLLLSLGLLATSVVILAFERVIR